MLISTVIPLLISALPVEGLKDNLVSVLDIDQADVDLMTILNFPFFPHVDVPFDTFIYFSGTVTE